MLQRLARRACAYHSNDSPSGKLYDSNGRVCETLSSEDKLFLAIALSLCGVVLLVLGGIGLTRVYKTRARSRAAQIAAEPKMSSMGTPLIRHAGSFASLSRQPSRSPPSPLFSSSGSSYHDDGAHSSPSSPGSPYSPNSEVFHFPILSADGHLLPPPPASSRQSVVELNPYEASLRPLPSAPLAAATPLYAPAPKSSQRWSYRTPSAGSGLQPGGLYAGVEIRGDGSLEVLRDEYDIGTANKRGSTTYVNSLEGFEAQAATYHHTPSVEGDDYSLYNYGSDEGYKRY